VWGGARGARGERTWVIELNVMARGMGDWFEECTVPSGGVLGLGSEGVLGPEDGRSCSRGGGVLIRRDMLYVSNRYLNWHRKLEREVGGRNLRLETDIAGLFCLL
jgi:hypothetical protein